MAQPTPSVLHVKASDPVESAQMGPYRIETLIDRADELGLTAYRVRIEAERQTATSYHKRAEEVYFVISGHGIAVFDGIEHRLQAGDFVRLPPGTRHHFVTGDEPLVMLDLHCPGSRPDRDVYFEGEAPDGFSGK